MFFMTQLTLEHHDLYCTGSLVRGCFPVENAIVPCDPQLVESADMGDVIWRANYTLYMDFPLCGGLVRWFPCSLNVRESVQPSSVSHSLSVMHAFLFFDPSVRGLSVLLASNKKPLVLFIFCSSFFFFPFPRFPPWS